jgi:hypothetical protein
MMAYIRSYHSSNKPHYGTKAYYVSGFVSSTVHSPTTVTLLPARTPATDPYPWHTHTQLHSRLGADAEQWLAGAGSAVSIRLRWRWLV